MERYSRISVAAGLATAPLLVLLAVAEHALGERLAAVALGLVVVLAASSIVAAAAAAREREPWAETARIVAATAGLVAVFPAVVLAFS